MADVLPRIDHIIIGALDIRIAAKHILDTYGLGGARIHPNYFLTKFETPGLTVHCCYFCCTAVQCKQAYSLLCSACGGSQFSIMLVVPPTSFLNPDVNEVKISTLTFCNTIRV